MVLLKDFDETGFVFYSNYESRKGLELAENPNAALVFYWRQLERQICITGTVSKVSREESEAYFRTRPRGSQIGALTSSQSQVVASREVLENRFQQLMAEYEGGEIPLPSYWGGYRLSPVTIEFWQGRSDRLHDRFLYKRQPGGPWQLERLSP
jgi:pyridoxamine 5'-phosphate oxidase